MMRYTGRIRVDEQALEGKGVNGLVYMIIGQSDFLSVILVIGPFPARRHLRICNYWPPQHCNTALSDYLLGLQVKNRVFPHT
ncbi:hypothetical protein AYI69_g9003 [Smittium culicis]|uniref:Uncharacterized protein n=1 Tax=Smittium culicis TaxID=133412 RepID=A0A1R1XFN9_9FUNG|nr:hypothetical protein AYI69_g9003 [Smittium culicis]